MVFYSTSVLSLVDLLQQSNRDVLDLFDNPYKGVPQLEGNELDLTSSDDTQQVENIQHFSYVILTSDRSKNSLRYFIFVFFF